MGRSEELLVGMAIAIERSSDVVIITNVEGTILRVNAAFEATTGYGRDEAEGQNPRFLKSGVHDREHYREMWLRLSRGEPWSGVFVNRRKDGTHYTAETTVTPMLGVDNEVCGFVAMQRDVTAQRAWSDALLQSQKLEAVGKLAGGVAHDINNILAAIMVSASLLRDTRSELNPLDVIENACRRGRDLVTNLLGFAGKGAFEARAVSLNAIVQDSVRLLRSSLLRRVELNEVLADELPAILADSGQVGQIVVNLCLNASDALDGSGVVTLTTGLHLDAQGCSKVRLVVKDAGKGMTEQVRQRVFEPFFTTKPPEQGTGLGLAMAYGTMRAHGGTITVESELGEGTSVTLDFPAHPHHPGPVFAPPSKVHRRGGTGGVLVVDDEQVLADCLQALLESEGYRAWCARNGADALRMYDQHMHAIDVVVLDLLMPGISGLDVLAHVRARNPDVAVVAMSGFAGEALIGSATALGASAFLPKPFELDELLDTIEDLISGQAPPRIGGSR